MEAKIAAQESAIVKATSAHAAEIAKCKGAAWDKAVALKISSDKKEDDEAAEALVVSAAYKLASAFATGGAANTNCAYPEPSADGV